jgi:hypothetical protein
MKLIFILIQDLSLQATPSLAKELHGKKLKLKKLLSPSL